MGKIVVVAEKPSVGKSIAKVLKCFKNDEGFCFNDKYIVTWAVGHLVTLMNPDEIDKKYSNWNMEDLPMLPTNIPLKVIPSSEKQFSIVSKLINSSDTDSLICATDAGREGELIFRYIYIQAGCKKPFQRLWISSLTDEAIRDGFANLAPGSKYDALYRSAKCRSEADWLVGMNASRAFTLRYDVLLSVGRVQTPTLAFLTKRRKEIDEFDPQPYFTLTADFGDYKGIMFSEKLNPDTHITVRKQAETVVDMIRGQTGIITTADTQRKKESPPQLYDLTSLQRDANKRFGFTAERTLQLAQSLYESHKAITYPRTDSRYLSDDMIPVIAQTMHKLPADYLKFIDGALHDGSVSVSKRTFDASMVSDHHAILPTNQKHDIDKMTSDESKLFDMIITRMLEAFYPPCEYDSTKIVTTVNNRFTFRTLGKMIINPGWRSIRSDSSYTDNVSKDNSDPNSEDVSSSTLPVLRKGDTRNVVDSTIKDCFTKAPPEYTDASLLLAMETAGKDSEDEEIVQQMKGHGIGTPATRAAILERLLDVKYAVRKGKSIIATEKGCALIQIMPEYISSAETTGKWEVALDKIAESKFDPDAFMESIRKYSSYLVDYAKTNSVQFNEKAFEDLKRKPKARKLDELICPVCKKGNIQETDNAFGCSNWKDGCHFTIWKSAFEKKHHFSISLDMIKELLQAGVSNSWSGGSVYMNDDFGRKSIYIILAGETKIADILTVERISESCPCCKKGKISESLWSFSCDKCGFVVWKNSFGKAGGPELISLCMFEDLLTEGKTDAVYLGTPIRDGIITMDEDSLNWYAKELTPNVDEPSYTCSLVSSSKVSSKKRKTPSSSSNRSKSGTGRQRRKSK